MTRTLYWQRFADATIDRLVRPGPGDPLLILASTENDLVLAEALLSAGVRQGADTQLLVKPRSKPGPESQQLGPIISNAIRHSRFIVSICDDGFDASPPVLEARRNGARLLICDVTDIEDYCIRGLLNVDQDKMNRNARRVADLWDQTKNCRLTSPVGTDVTFDLHPRKSLIGDGVLKEDGVVEFFPGTQVSIAPVEDTIEGRIVVDASDSVQGLVYTPYTLHMKKGKITKVDGGREAATMEQWLRACNEEIIYELCHFSLGLNPEAGICGRMNEDERKLAAVDFGFGYQDPDFGGTVGLGTWHMDIMLAAPTVFLDGVEMSGSGTLNDDMGFEM